MTAVLEVYGPHVSEGLASFEWEVPSLAEMTRRWRAIVDVGFPFIIAECEGKVLGYAYAGPHHTRPGYRFTVEDSVYVHREHHGRGVGRLLLGSVLGSCERIGARQALAVIGDSNNAGSIRLHASFGFRRVGTLVSVGFKLGRWVDVVLMQRSIGSGDAELPAV